MVKSDPASRNVELNHGRGVSQEAGDGRRGGGDDFAPPGTSGGLFGLSGAERQALAIGWVAGMTLVLLICTFDVITRAHEHPESLASAVVDEGSSALVMAGVLLLPMAIALWVRRTAPSVWQAALAWLAGAVAWPVLHVAGFVAIRKLVYNGLAGGHYHFGRLPGEFLYEASKDVPAFIFAAVASWLILRWRCEAQASRASGAEVFDIRDGARILRVPVAEILAVRSAGNYVEFLLGDGRSPLMRAALSALEPKLAGLGFVRTHRSWLVNSARMSGLRPDGSGDYTVELGALEAPLSRRFPKALARLRA